MNIINSLVSRILCHLVRSSEYGFYIELWPKAAQKALPHPWMRMKEEYFLESFSPSLHQLPLVFLWVNDAS